MNNRYYVLSFVIGLFIFTSCDQRKINDLQSSNDSLRQQLKQMNADSAQTTQYVDPMSQKTFSSRVEYIHYLLKASEKEVKLLTDELHATNDSSFAYEMMVYSLQDEVGIRDGELHAMNAKMVDKSSKYEVALASMRKEIDTREKELAQLELSIAELKRINTAEAYYNKAQTVEHSARRMTFAFKKKRETLREALELYQKSFTLGKKEAEKNVLALKKALRTSKVPS
jgi:hypothetical protein